MPTFLIFKAGRETKRIRGADVKALDAAVKLLAQEAAASGAGADGSSASASGSGYWTGAAAPKGYVDVTEQVDQKGLDFLNLDGDAGNAKTVFQPGKPSTLDGKAKANGNIKDWIQSDTDEQLMLFIPFQSTMKLHSIHITSIPQTDDEQPTSRPKTLRLFSNRSTVLGFDEAESTPATQTIELKESDWDPKTHTAKVELRFVKFQNISSVVIFVVDGDSGAEQTRIDRLRLLGESGEKKSMGKLEKIGNEAGE